MLDDQPDNASALLGDSLANLDDTYKQYEAVRTEIATNEFLSDSYASLDTAYKALVFPLSPAYLTGSDWYTGDDLPLALFDLLVMIGLIQNACCYAVRRGCSDQRLKKCVAASMTLVYIDSVD